VHLAVVDDDAGIAQGLNRHLDVRQAREGLAVVEDRDAFVVARPGEQQPGDELRGRGGVDGDVAAPNATDAGYAEWQTAGTLLDRDAESPQCVQDRRHRPDPGVLVTVEADGPAGQARNRGDEAHHIAGQSAVDGAASDEGGRGDQPVIAVEVIDADPQGPQGAGHELGVARPQRPPQPRRVLRQGRNDQIAVRQGLAARQDDGGVDRSNGRGCGPVGRISGGHRGLGPP
jgi:hypothetical protein